MHGGKIAKVKSDPSSNNEESDVIKIDDEWSYTPSQSEGELNLIRKKGTILPTEGFYAIECLSKNKIMVDGHRVEQGHIALLNHGSTIKMLTFTLYFLLPEDCPSNPTVVSVPLPAKEVDDDSDDDAESISAPPQKKIKKENDDQHADQRTLSELMAEFLHAIESGNFERKHSMISTSILQHAVVDATKDAKLREQSKTEGGVSRATLMDWIASSDVYGKYVTALLTKLEMKSYQQNLSRALIRAEFTRIGTTGRHIKWILPGTDMPNADEPKPANTDESAEKKTAEKETEVQPEEKEEPEEERATQATNLSNDIMSEDKPSGGEPKDEDMPMAESVVANEDSKVDLGTGEDVSAVQKEVVEDTELSNVM